MYELKDTPNIIYIDVERALLTKPTVFCDNTKTPFTDKQFDTIFYDPPHGFGEKQFDHANQMKDAPSTKITHLPFGATYYGWDKYSNQQSLIVHVYKAQREFHRILKDDGLLWIKWNECRISLHRVLRLFEDWNILMRLPLADLSKTWGKSKSYWIVLTKKKKEYKQLCLS
jgi:tRNA G10  N-methylase Trm11